MSVLHDSGRQPATRRIPDAVPWLQGPAGGVSASFAAPAGGDAGRVCQTSGQHAWPGRDFGIRAPYPSETPLSWGEVHHAVMHGLI